MRVNHRRGGDTVAGHVFRQRHQQRGQPSITDINRARVAAQGPDLAVGNNRQAQGALAQLFINQRAEPLGEQVIGVQRQVVAVRFDGAERQ